MSKLIGIYEGQHHIEEASGNIAGFPILGKVCGPSFVPNGMSRNKRFYPESLWEKVLRNESVQNRLKNGTVFGTIGHDLDIDEKALREGTVSHITKIMEIRTPGGSPIGYCEHFILDTPVGQRLNNYLRSGANLYVSSRADGDFKGTTPEGIPMLDPDKYIFERFDFVLDPGFLEANPKLTEGLDKEIVESIQKQSLLFNESVVNVESQFSKESAMPLPQSDAQGIDGQNGDNVKPAGDAVVVKPAPVTTQGIDKGANADNVEGTTRTASDPVVVEGLRTQLGEVLTANAKLREELEQATAAKAQIQALDPDDLESLKDLTGGSDMKECFARIRKFREDVGTLPEAEDMATTTAEFIKEVGEPAAIKEAFGKFKEFFNTVGKPERIREALSLAKGFYAKYGKPGQIGETLDKANEAWAKLGTPEQIDEALAAASSMVKKITEAKTTSDAQSAKQLRAYKLRESTGIDLIKIQEKIAEGMSDKSILEHFRFAGHQRPSDKVLFGEKNESGLAGGSINEAIGDSAKSLMTPLFKKTESVSRLGNIVQGSANG